MKVVGIRIASPGLSGVFAALVMMALGLLAGLAMMRLAGGGLAQMIGLGAVGLVVGLLSAAGLGFDRARWIGLAVTSSAGTLTYMLIVALVAMT